MWHTKTADEALRELSSGRDGLGREVAALRLRENGPNVLRKRGGRGPLRILWEQFSATMVLILLGAGILALALGDRLEASAIFAIVILFGLMGFIQEHRAERSLDALKRLSVPSVRVRRDGELREISSADIVPGDIVLIEAGNIIPADCRIIDSWGCRVQESALTGESEAIDKVAATMEGPDLPLGDRRNMLYMGTIAITGRAEAVVVATGMATELGKIASLIQEVEESSSPMQRRLDRLGKALALAGLGLSVLVVALGVAFAGETVWDMLLVGVSMAVAIIPEGLPAVLTITLALGASRMLKRHALIRKLPAVESLGCVTVICSDKTGTLTQNRMTVVEILCTDRAWNFSEGVPTASSSSTLAVAEAIGVLCNDAKLSRTETEARGKIIGDPTEGCLLEIALRSGMEPESLALALPRLGERSFDSERKRMSTLHALGGASGTEMPGFIRWLIDRDGDRPEGASLLAVKGSPDGLFALCSRVLGEEGPRVMSESELASLSRMNAELARQGKRVLGLAYRFLRIEDPAADDADIDTGSLESDLVFAGLVGIIDPPRPEVRAAIATCKRAGIRPIMITGDHPLTAAAIARDLGIDERMQVITGAQITAMEDSELEAELRSSSVFARVSPEHKLRIVSALQAQRHVVAMTGDGVNDAPALRKADIGIAMGVTGTDVSKEASQMVLTDDNFASIVSAVEEGRAIYDNIRKYIKFSLGGNAGKVLVLLAMPLVTALLSASGIVSSPPIIVGLSAIQLLWLNLLCDGLLSIGLGVERAERGVMDRKPLPPRSGIIDAESVRYLAVNGMGIGLIALAAGLWQWAGQSSADSGAAQHEARTAVFLALYFGQLWSVFEVRTGRHSAFHAGMGHNGAIYAMAAASLVLQFAALYLPKLRDFLGTAYLPLDRVLFLAIVAAAVIPLLELLKLAERRLGRER